MSIARHRASFFDLFYHCSSILSQEIVVGWLHEALDSLQNGDSLPSEVNVNYVCPQCLENPSSRSHGDSSRTVYAQKQRQLNRSGALGKGRSSTSQVSIQPTVPAKVLHTKRSSSALFSPSVMRTDKNQVSKGNGGIERGQTAGRSATPSITTRVTDVRLRSNTPNGAQIRGSLLNRSVVTLGATSIGSTTTSVNELRNRSQTPRSAGTLSSAETPNAGRQFVRSHTQNSSMQDDIFQNFNMWIQVWSEKVSVATQLLVSTIATWTSRLNIIHELYELLDRGMIRLQSRPIITTDALYNTFRRIMPLFSVQLRDSEHPQVPAATAQVVSLCSTALGPLFASFFPTVLNDLPTLPTSVSHGPILNIIKTTQDSTVLSYLEDHKNLHIYGDYYLAILCIMVENAHPSVSIEDDTGNVLHAIRLVNGQTIASLRLCFSNSAIKPDPLPVMASHPLDPYYDCISSYVQHNLKEDVPSSMFGSLLFWPFYICAPQIATVLFNNAGAEIRMHLTQNVPDNWDFVVHTPLRVVHSGKETTLTQPVLASTLHLPRLFVQPGSSSAVPLTMYHVEVTPQLMEDKMESSQHVQEWTPPITTQDVSQTPNQERSYHYPNTPGGQTTRSKSRSSIHSKSTNRSTVVWRQLV